MDKKARLAPNSPEYQRIHKWVVKEMGRADLCVNGCRASRYCWSNISRDYLMIHSDWEKVCDMCHKKRDKMTKEGKESIKKKNRLNSLGNQSHAQPVLAIFSNGSWIKYASSVKASKALNISRTSISNILVGLANKTHSGFSFRKLGG